MSDFDDYGVPSLSDAGIEKAAEAIYEQLPKNRDALRSHRIESEDSPQQFRAPGADEAEQPVYTARREQLRARLLRALTRVSRRWEEGGRGDSAVDCYLRCIDADELCEAFYRNLMLCYQRQGDVAEAVATFERLQAVLAARLRSMPSPETQAIHDGLRA